MKEVIEAVDLKKGVLVEIEGKGICEVVEKEHVKLARSGAFVRCRLKDFFRGIEIEKTFKPDEKLTLVKIFEKEGEFLYTDKDMYYFIREDTYEEITLHKDSIKDILPYLKENTKVQLLYWNDKFLSVKLPEMVELIVVETEAGFKGDTVSSPLKQAKIETGAIIQVPLFINKGDIIKINTRTGKYIERASKS